MQRASKILGFVFIGLASVWFYACGGGSDLLDEVNQRYAVDITMLEVAPDEETLTIDIAQDDCDFNSTTVDDFEDYGPTAAVVRITVLDSNAPGITLQRYAIEYIPRLSEDGTGTLVMPPDLDSPLPGSYGLDIPAGGTAEFSITCISVDTKQEYRLKSGWTLCNGCLGGDEYFWMPPTLDEGRYTIRLTFYFEDEEGQERTIVREATVWFGDFDRC